MDTDLITTCAIAFGAVLSILGGMAVLIRLLTALFPDNSPEADAGLMSALETAVTEAFPGASVVAVESDNG